MALTGKTNIKKLIEFFTEVNELKQNKDNWTDANKILKIIEKMIVSSTICNTPKLILLLERFQGILATKYNFKNKNKIRTKITE